MTTGLGSAPRAAGLLLVLVGVLLPQGWYGDLPQTELTPLLRGITLLRVSLIVEGFLLLGLARRGWRHQVLEPACRLPRWEYRARP